MKFLTRGVVLAVSSGVAMTAAAQPRACTRPPARTFQAGETVVIKDPVKPPCTIVFTETGIELKADTAKKVQAIAGAVVRGPDGRFYTSTGRGEITVWSPKGTVVKKIGALGRGQGEFAPGNMSIMFDHAGRMYVRDGNGRWSIFSPSLTFVRTVSAQGMGSEARHSAFLDNGLFLTTGSTVGRHDTFFHVFDFAKTETHMISRKPNEPLAPEQGPAHVRSFGNVLTRETHLPPASLERLISYTGGDTFWAGPPMSAGHGYEIELWKTDGTRLRTIRREASWFPPGADSPPPPAVRGRPRPPTQVVTLQSDPSGLVYVGVFVPNDKWGPIAVNIPPAEQQKKLDEMAELHVEVIDANAGVVLAESGPIRRSRALAEYALGFMTGTMGYRPAPLSVPAMRIVEYHLVSK